MISDEVEKIPLRHESNKAAASRQMSEVSERKCGVPNLSIQTMNFLMRKSEQLVQQTKLGNHLKGRRVDRVTAKIAQEVRMLFQNDDINAGPGEQEAQHHSGRSAASNAATGRKRFSFSGLHGFSAIVIDSKWKPAILRRHISNAGSDRARSCITSLMALLPPTRDQGNTDDGNKLRSGYVLMRARPLFLTI